MRTTVAGAALALILAGGTPALATEVSKSTILAAPVETVWQAVAPFCSVADWHPAVETCELSQVAGKQIRHLGLKGGGTIDEQLQHLSKGRHSLTYTILAAPLPVKDYVSTITLSEAKGGTRIVWKSRFTANGASEADAAKVVGGIYTAGFDGLKAKLKGK